MGKGDRLNHDQECVLVFAYYDGSVTVDEVANVLGWLNHYEQLQLKHSADPPRSSRRIST